MARNFTVLRKKMWDEALMSRVSHRRLEDLLEQGNLEQAFPEVHRMVGFGDGRTHKDLWKHVKQVVHQCPFDVTLRWVALFHDIGKPSTFSRDGGKVMFHGHEMLGGRMFDKICRRTGLWADEPEQARDIRWLIVNSGRAHFDETWTDSAVRRLITESGSRLDRLIDFTLADITSQHVEKHEKNQRRVAELRLSITRVRKEDARRTFLPKGLGTHIISDLGVTPGPGLGEIIANLRASIDMGELEPHQEIDYYIEHLRGR